MPVSLASSLSPPPGLFAFLTVKTKNFTDLNSSARQYSKEQQRRLLPSLLSLSFYSICPTTQWRHSLYGNCYCWSKLKQNIYICTLDLDAYMYAWPWCIYVRLTLMHISIYVIMYYTFSHSPRCAQSYCGAQWCNAEQYSNFKHIFCKFRKAEAKQGFF